MEIGFGHPYLPVAVVRFVVSHEWDYGDAADHGADDIEPGIPLIVVLPVIYEVAHIDEKLGIVVALPGRLSRSRPVTVITRLGIREDEGFEIISPGRLEFLPFRPFFSVSDAVFVRRSRCEVLQQCAVDVGRRIIVVKGFICRLLLEHVAIRSLDAVFDQCRLFGKIRLPHDGAARHAVTGDNLAYVRGIDIAGQIVVSGCCFGDLYALTGHGFGTGDKEISSYESGCH